MKNSCCNLDLKEIRKNIIDCALEVETYPGENSSYGLGLDHLPPLNWKPIPLAENPMIQPPKPRK